MFGMDTTIDAKNVVQEKYDYDHENQKKNV